MNKVILCGRLTRDPEIRYTQREKPMTIARYTLAVDKKTKKQGEQGADFINCLCFAKNAEFAEKFLHQGLKIIVVGSWQTGSYTNKEGQKVYTNDCLVSEHYFCESKSESNQQNPNSQKSNVDSDFVRIPDGINDENLPFD